MNKETLGQTKLHQLRLGPSQPASVEFIHAECIIIIGEVLVTANVQ